MQPWVGSKQTAVRQECILKLCALRLRYFSDAWKR